MASRSLICCSLASLSSADSEASRSRWQVLICCSLASLSLQLIWWPVGPSSVVAWPLSLQLTRWPVGPSSAVAWPLSLQLTRWPVGHVFAAEVIAFVRQSEQRAELSPSFFVYSAVPPVVPLSLSYGGPSLAPAFVEGVSLSCPSLIPVFAERRRVADL